MTEYDPITDSERARSTVQVKAVGTLQWYIGGIFYVVFRTTKFTDYVLPYLLAAAAVLTSLYFEIDWEPERLAALSVTAP